MEPIYKYRGAVSKCDCTNPTKPVGCPFCFARGWVAECLNCDGTGRITEKAAWDGTSKMSNTCNICGGSGKLPVNKPDADAAPELAAPVETLELEAPKVPIGVPEAAETVEAIA